MRSHSISVALIVLVLLATAAETAVASSPLASDASADEALASRDILLITIDTLRVDALGFSGNQRAVTPTLDRLAAGGRVFSRAYAHNVVTLPSHANLLTGRYPYQHGVRENSGFRLSEKVPTLAVWLRTAGYATAAFVAAYPLVARYGLDNGFEVFDDELGGAAADAFHFPERPGTEVVARALDWWQSEPRRPRFLWLHLFDPHAPYLPDARWASLFANNLYAGEVAATDAALRPLLEPLLADEESDSLVVFTADHGEALGDHGELTHGLFAYEATLHIPLVLWGKGVTPGFDDRLVGHIDIVPTLLSLLQIEVPPELPGRSLLAAEIDAPRTIYFESLSTYLNRGWAPLRGVLSGSLKAISLPLPELYDLAADPRERNNLAVRERAQLELLLAELPVEDSWPPLRAAIDTEEARNLRALGYLTGTPAVSATFSEEDDPKRLAEIDRDLQRFVDAYSRGELATAIELGHRIVAARPSMPLGYDHLNLALRADGRIDEAIELLRSALASGVDTPSVRRQLALSLAEAGQALAAIAVLEPIRGEADPETQTALGLALSDAGRQLQAVAVLQRALQLDPDHSSAHETLGIVYLRMRRPQEAIQHLREAVHLNRELVESWNGLGVARAWMGDTSGAIAAWEEAVSLQPDHLQALYNLGSTAAAQGDHSRARNILRHFVDVAPAGADRQAALHLLQGLGE